MRGGGGGQERVGKIMLGKGLMGQDGSACYGREGEEIRGGDRMRR